MNRGRRPPMSFVGTYTWALYEPEQKRTVSLVTVTRGLQMGGNEMKNRLVIVFLLIGILLTSCAQKSKTPDNFFAYAVETEENGWASKVVKFLTPLEEFLKAEKLSDSDVTSEGKSQYVTRTVSVDGVSAEITEKIEFYQGYAVCVWYRFSGAGADYEKVRAALIEQAGAYLPEPTRGSLEQNLGTEKSVTWGDPDDFSQNQAVLALYGPDMTPDGTYQATFSVGVAKEALAEVLGVEPR